MFQGTLEAIFVGPVKGGPMQRVESVRAVPGVGLEDDRHGSLAYSTEQPNDADRQVTLIEAEALEGAAGEYDLAIEAVQTRRNLLVRGVPLNHLVGREFMVGQVRLRGIRLCEPCGHMEKLAVPGIRKALVHRGGLRAEIIEGGTLQTGDAVQPVDLSIDSS
jgi:MOSC domain-containing protein YiiM